MAKGIIGPLDALLDFGEITLGSAGTNAFSNIIDLGSTNADSLECVVNVEADGVGGTNFQLAVQGSANGSSSWTTIEAGEVAALAKIKQGAIFRVGIPRDNGYRYLRLAAVTTGTFTGGKLHGWLDTYTGK